MPKLADAILAADLHIRPDKPRSRKDNFQEAMWKKIRFILNLSLINGGCPILVAGDLGQEAEWPNWLLRKFIAIVMEFGLKIYVVPGQHDLINHNLSLWPRSALGVLEVKETITLLLEPLVVNGRSTDFCISPFPYNTDIKPPSDLCKDLCKHNIALVHELVLEGKPKGWEEGMGESGATLLKRFPEYKLILTGDNHKPFVSEYRGRLLVNPGSMMRSAADQIDHKPRVYLWYAEENKVKLVYLPINEDVLSRDHIDKELEKDKRMKAFVESVKPGELKIKFEENMKSHLQKNPVSSEVEEKIWQSVV